MLISTLKPFASKIWLSSPTMHGDEQLWVDNAIQTNWVSTVGENINEIEKEFASYIGVPYAVALSSGTTALHLAIRLIGEKLYGKTPIGHGILEGKKVFASDMTFSATVNPVAYEAGECVFIDTEKDTWNMDPEALEQAFKIYPDVRLIILAHLYGTPCKMDEIRAVAKAHNAYIIEDAAESLGASYKSVSTGALGDVGVISFNGNKIITGSSGGMLFCRDKADADKVRKWSTQSREAADWYQHEELGYNYRMSNIIAGIIRGQLPYLDEHIQQKRKIYLRYKDGLKNLPVSMNPYDDNVSDPNFWLSCLIIDQNATCENLRDDKQSVFIASHGKTCPAEILEALRSINAEGRPIWKPMHLQPMYRINPFITKNGNGRANTNAYIVQENIVDVGEDIFRRGLCLPSDNKMTEEQQDAIIELIQRCFD